MTSTSDEKINKVTNALEALSKMPMIARLISVIASLVAIGAIVLGLTSCGVTRAVVHNGATGTVTEIKITTSNPTSVSASPNVQIPLNPQTNVKENETP